MHSNNKYKGLLKNREDTIRELNTYKFNYTLVFQITILIFLIGVYFDYKNFSLINLLGQEEYLADRISLGKGRGLQVLLSHWIYVATIIFFFLWLVIKQKPVSKSFKLITLLFFIFSFVSVLIYYGINSNRNSIFILIINLLIIYFTFKPQKSGETIKFGAFFKLSFVFVFFIFLFFQLGKNRRQGALRDNTANYSIIESFNGAFGNHENIVWLIEHSNKKELYYGATYVAGVTNFVPRSIWPEKPLGAGPKLKNTIYPGSYVVGERGNSSLTTGLFNELQMNFGIIGILVGGLLYGIFLNKIGILSMQTSNPINFVIIQYTLTIFSSAFIYAEFLGFLARFIITLIPFFIIKFLTKK
jgi:oligosaccharide repeat unit polymerase